jgi:hypothetical protein
MDAGSTFVAGDIQIVRDIYHLPTGVVLIISAKPSGFLISFQEVLEFLGSLSEFPESSQENTF